MTLLDAHGREIQIADIHDPQNVSADDAALLARMTDEFRELDAEGSRLGLGLSALAAMQISGLLQLALQTHEPPPDIRETALQFLDGVRDFFADSPACREILRRGDLDQDAP